MTPDAIKNAKGYEVHYQEFAGNHDPINCRGTLADGLIALLGTESLTSRLVVHDQLAGLRHGKAILAGKTWESSKLACAPALNPKTPPCFWIRGMNQG